VNPTTQKGYVLVAHTAFSKGSKDRGYSECLYYPYVLRYAHEGYTVNPIVLRRTKATFVYGATLEIPSYDVKEDPLKLKGFPSELVEMPPVLTAQILDGEGPYTELVVPEYFPPGSIMVFETHIPDHDATLDKFCVAGAQEAFANLNLIDLNVVLHRADGEERDATEGKYGVYEIPGYGRLTYCGLEGWMHPLRQIMRSNDLGHSLCGHLREGTWAFEYVSARLKL
jgi:glycogen debranching enzyme